MPEEDEEEVDDEEDDDDDDDNDDNASKKLVSNKNEATNLNCMAPLSTISEVSLDTESELLVRM